MKSFVSTALVCLALVSCNDPLSSSEAEVPIIRLRTEPYSFEWSSGFSQHANIVVRDAQTWQSIWNKVYERRSPIPPLPEIDFSKEAVVVAAMGQRGSGGYGVILDRAFENELGGIAVIVLSVSPGRDCVTPAVLTQPVDIARIPARYVSVEFVEQLRVSNCGN